MKKRTFYSHVNYSVTKIHVHSSCACSLFYSHVNYSVTKIVITSFKTGSTFTVT